MSLPEKKTLPSTDHSYSLSIKLYIYNSSGNGKDGWSITGKNDYDNVVIAKKESLQERGCRLKKV
jgi:hypothetical protein